MEYGEHEPLLATESEEKEMRYIFQSLIHHFNEQPDNTSVLISYAHVLITLIETFYQRQFSRDAQKYNHTVTAFQKLLHGYYNHDVTQLPNVQYFAGKVHLTSNYLGDIIKHYTDKTAIETIHDSIIQEAKELITQNRFNMSQIAFELVFDFPDNFSNFFKNHTELTPSEFRSSRKTADAWL